MTEVSAGHSGGTVEAPWRWEPILPEAGFMREKLALQVALKEITPQTRELTNGLDQG